jgi:hypothetical protein
MIARDRSRFRVPRPSPVPPLSSPFSPLSSWGLSADGRRPRSWISGLLLLTLALCPAATIAADSNETQISLPASRTLSAFDGQWRRVDDEQDHSRRLTSIDSAVSDLSWMVRKMASGLLKKSTAPPEKMNFSWDGQQLHQVVDGDNGDFRRAVKLGGDPETLTDKRGEDFSSKWTWTPSGLQVDWVQKQAYGSNLYSVNEHDQTLLVEHRIHITAISDVEPIVYQSRFDRAEPPAVSASTTQEGAAQLH